MKKVGKTVARKAFDNGEHVVLIPCKMRLDTMFNSSIDIDKGNKNLEGVTFESIVNNVEYYNCSTKNGRYCSYYIEI